MPTSNRGGETNPVPLLAYFVRRLPSGRSKFSVELKHQNISDVLVPLYINRYKPWGNS